MSRHSTLCKDVVAFAQSRGHYAYRVTNSGYGRSGFPDVLLCINGLFATVEVKVRPDKPTPWQLREMESIQNAKGRTFVAYDLASAEDFIKRVENGAP